MLSVRNTERCIRYVDVLCARPDAAAAAAGGNAGAKAAAVAHEQRTVGIIVIQAAAAASGTTIIEGDICQRHAGRICTNAAADLAAVLGAAGAEGTLGQRQATTSVIISVIDASAFILRLTIGKADVGNIDYGFVGINRAASATVVMDSGFTRIEGTIRYR